MTGRVRALIAVGTALVVAAVLVVVLVVRGGSGGSHGAGEADVRIPAAGDITLAARTFTPEAAQGDPALVLMPVPFGAQLSLYDVLASRLMEDGYQVVTYLQRGFHESGGQVDFAGPITQGDASTVITWALAHTHADADSIGVLGVSYGAGVGLLAAAHDDRIKAVAALSTWTDLAESFDPNGTPSSAVLQSLLGQAGDRLSPSVQVLRTSDTPGFGPALAQLSEVRSPQSYVAALNRNDPAILIANAYQDSYLPPAQLPRFFSALTTPKRLQLAPGDHGGPEYSGLLGDPNTTVDNAVAWLDHYVRGRANGVASWAKVHVVDAKSGTAFNTDDLPEGAAHPVDLGVPNTTGNVGTASGWSLPLRSRTDSGADVQPYRAPENGPFELETGTLSLLHAGTYALWTGPGTASDSTILGTPTVHFSLASSGTAATVFAYLYDVAADGSAQLVSSGPYTATGLTPGVPRPVTLALQPITWTVASGHHLGLVIDTADPRYTSPTPSGVTVTLSSSTTDPATVGVPVRS